MKTITLEEAVDQFNDMLSFVEVQTGISERDRLRAAFITYSEAVATKRVEEERERIVKDIEERMFQIREKGEGGSHVAHKALFDLRDALTPTDNKNKEK